VLRELAIGKLKPNPFRRLEEYPILRHKVEALKRSIEIVGFWASIVARPAGDEDVEIAFGHHRLVALGEMYPPNHTVTIFMRDLTNEQMLRMMANENMQEWSTSAWVEIETIRATIAAYGQGLIELPPMPAKTSNDHIRYAGQTSVPHTYTKLMIAEFLGWTRAKGSTIQPDDACDVAFMAIDAMEEGLIGASDIKLLHREHVKTTIAGMRQIRQAEEKEAALQREQAEQSRREAVEAKTQREREIHSRRAAVYLGQAKSSETAAKVKPARFRDAAVVGFRQGELTVHKARDLARSMTDVTSPNGLKVKNVDDIGMSICRRLDNLLEEGELIENIRFVKRNRIDLSDKMAERIRQSAACLSDRIKRRIIDGIKEHGERHRPPARDGGLGPKGIAQGREDPGDA
jgi:hypothetical protein